MDFTNKTIGEIVADDFRTATIFKKYGIDFCCKGGRTIQQACERKKVEETSLLAELNALSKEASSGVNINDWPLDLLANYISRIHHRYVREKSPYLIQFLDKLCRVHGDRHPELFKINEHFTACMKTLDGHFEKEEKVLFPYVTELVQAEQTTNSLVSDLGLLENSVDIMKHEHSVEKKHFEEISQLTDNYTPPIDACNTYRVTFAMLEEFENELHKYIHLENNILFPKGILLEKKIKG